MLRQTSPMLWIKGFRRILHSLWGAGGRSSMASKNEDDAGFMELYICIIIPLRAIHCLHIQRAPSVIRNCCGLTHVHKMDCSFVQEHLQTKILGCGADVVFHVLGFSASHNAQFLESLAFLGTADGSYSYVSPSVSSSQRLYRKDRLPRAYFCCRQLAKFGIVRGICLYNALLGPVCYQLTESCFPCCGVLGFCRFLFKIQDFMR